MAMGCGVRKRFSKGFRWMTIGVKPTILGIVEAHHDFVAS
jgi:hypothetical protein